MQKTNKLPFFCFMLFVLALGACVKQGAAQGNPGQLVVTWTEVNKKTRRTPLQRIYDGLLSGDETLINTAFLHVNRLFPHQQAWGLFADVFYVAVRDPNAWEGLSYDAERYKEFACSNYPCSHGLLDLYLHPKKGWISLPLNESEERKRSARKVVGALLASVFAERQMHAEEFTDEDMERALVQAFEASKAYSSRDSHLIIDDEDWRKWRLRRAVLANWAGLWKEAETYHDTLVEEGRMSEAAEAVCLVLDPKDPKTQKLLAQDMRAIRAMYAPNDWSKDGWEQYERSALSDLWRERSCAQWAWYRQDYLPQDAPWPDAYGAHLRMN